MGKRCSEISTESSEQLYGTAPMVNNWFLIEYNYEWKENVLNSSILSYRIKIKLTELLKSRSNSRLQWIKNNNKATNTINLYMIESTEKKKIILKKTLSSYEEILEIDSNNLLFNEAYTEKTLLLICTHRNYDTCCGEMGYNLYRDICNNENEYEVWQTTHLGGHRFAANLLILPEGLYYGRVDRDSYKLLKDDYCRKRMNINYLRGRCYYDKYTQIAEYYLRHNINNYELGSLVFLSSMKTDNSIICINFMDTGTKVEYKVLIKEEPDAVEICSSCVDNMKKSISQFRLLEIQ